MFEYVVASRSTPEAVALLDRAREAARAEARAAAARLVAVAELLVLRCRETGERADWAADAWEAVAAQVGAALGCSVAMGHSYLRYAMAMRERLPQVGAVFAAGGIDYRAFQTLVFRTDLITDAQVLARVDATLAVLVSRRPSLTRGGLAAAVDRVVAAVDADAVRRARDAVTGRYLDVRANESGMAWVEGNVLGPDGHALDRRLDELASGVCAGDPRSRAQRRADALGALAAGAGRLACGCGSPDCPSAAAPAPRSTVVIHVVAEQATVAGRGATPAVVAGLDGLIPAQVIAELAASARLVPVAVPEGGPEPGYTPSARLADFIRCRDLTCRAPGCDRPAVDCDVDHTIPYAQGGPTHPSNLKCLCRGHHLLKTFWGWRDRQLPDGTVIWTLPDGDTYVTTPGSALLFPTLCTPTGAVSPAKPDTEHRCGERTAMMPLRRHTRAHNRAHRITTERNHNRRTRLTTHPATPGPAPPPDPDD
ncbi:HNH endonuclease signature motif containing protein, partial [Mycobacterium avium]